MEDPVSRSGLAVRQFQDHIDAGLGQHRHDGINGHDERKQFVCMEALHDYWTLEKITEVCGQKSSVIAEEIRHSYLQIFSILCFISHPEYIRYITPNGAISDANLPILQSLVGRNSWPSDPASVEVWNKFYECQWMFSPLTFDTIVHRREIPFERVLPVCGTKKQLQTGNGSTIYLVKLCACCSKPDSQEIVFKVLSDDNPAAPSLWETEVGLYATLHNDSSSTAFPLSSAAESLSVGSPRLVTPFDFITKYHGSFIQSEQKLHRQPSRIILQTPGISGGRDDSGVDETEHEKRKIRTIVLEYVPGGDLIKFCHDKRDEIQSQSRDKKEILWQQMFHILQGVGVMHQLGITHQDIKESNILYTGGSLGDLDKACFKIADLGKAHQDIKTPLKHPNNSGNRLRMAPECCEINPISIGRPGPFTPSADIWAFGCVLSVMLVRSLLGEDAVQRYGEARLEENSDGTIVRGTGYDGGFHNGLRRLAAVDRMHEEALRACPPDDDISPIVSDLILNQMLREKKQRNKSAFKLRLEWLSRMAELQGSKSRHVTMPATLDLRAPPQSSSIQEAMQGPRPGPPLEFLNGASSPGTSSRFPPSQPPVLDTPQAAILTANGEAIVDASSLLSAPGGGKHSVAEATERLRSRKRKLGRRGQRNIAKFLSLPGSVEEAYGRRYRFLVDNSQSMKAYMNNVADTIYAIVRVVKRKMAPGSKVVVSFVAGDQSTDISMGSKSTKFAETIKSTPYMLPVAEKWRLGIRLEGIVRDIAATLSEGHRPITLYILTDGVFRDAADPRVEPPNLANPIGSLVTSLRDKPTLGSSFVSINIIRFGDSQDGIRALTAVKLDVAKSLRLADTKHSPVHIWPWDGDIMDMLVGALRISSTNSDLPRPPAAKAFTTG
ncbi:hypothetical protein B0T22DRAFT_534455 [Podospora appendiculata]|uniref:Protein kinase domain-containing protein n=1 Tax=Podospora appendiculata TaxID=314037 RepID=A0AAE1CIK2_9PEZI|nr:hypothetical protein B0T22DRAFT_534455 [Podospora appendiculata]